jgi:hypothetical protein
VLLRCGIVDGLTLQLHGYTSYIQLLARAWACRGGCCCPCLLLQGPPQHQCSPRARPRRGCS